MILAGDKIGSVDPSIFENIKSHLEGLKRTPDGAVLYSLIARGLKRFGIDDGGIELAFVTFLYSVLGRYAIDPSSHPVTRMKARLLQQRLVPYLPENEPLPEPASELENLTDDTSSRAVGIPSSPASTTVTAHAPPPEMEDKSNFKAQAEQATSADKKSELPSAGAEPPEKTDSTATNIVTEPSVPETQADASQVEPKTIPPTEQAPVASPPPEVLMKEKKTAPEPPDKKDSNSQAPTSVKKQTPPLETAPIEVSATSDVSPQKATQVHTPTKPPEIALKHSGRPTPPSEPIVVERSDVHDQSVAIDSDRLDKLEQTFVVKMSEAVTHNEEIDNLMRQTLTTLQQTQTEQGLAVMKQMLIAGLQELIQGRSKLGENLRGTDTFMRVIRTERKQLHDTVRKLRKHSVADELTGLPNRSFFIRQLEGELSRAKRYGFSLAVAIMDVDNLKAVNDQYGRATGDEILRCYANEILSMFRGYDLVARYDDDEFAALFPNTQKDGAMRALEKAQKRAAETYITCNGKSIPLPTFSSVLTLYTPGEKPATLLKRADEALAHAKQRGRNRVVVALPPG